MYPYIYLFLHKVEWVVVPPLYLQQLLFTTVNNNNTYISLFISIFLSDTVGCNPFLLFTLLRSFNNNKKTNYISLTHIFRHTQTISYNETNKKIKDHPLSFFDVPVSHHIVSISISQGCCPPHCWIHFYLSRGIYHAKYYS